MQNPEVIINGQRGEQISALDRGLLYGDGVFETIAVRQGKLQFWDDHLERLQLGCAALNLKGLDEGLLGKEVQQLADIDSHANCVIKVIVTRGVGSRGYKPTQQTLTRIVQKFSWPEQPASYIDQGVNVTQCAFRLAKQSKLAQIKHLNRLEQVLARSEWSDEFQEGLVCDADNNIIEGTSSNVFFQLNETLITPDLSQCGVAGVMRKKIIEYCHSNHIEVQVRDFNLSEINDIQAMLLCNSVHGVWPVSRYCERKLTKTAIIDKIMAVFNS